MLLLANAYAATVEIPGVDSKKFISGIKEVQIEEQLINSEEVRNCIKKAKYNPADNEQAKIKKLNEAQTCFQNELPKDKAALESFSNSLGLQQYGLVQGTNVQEITKFLSDKLYKAMTGVDRNEKRLGELLKAESFKNRKIVDQRDFIDLYKTQLTKNALFEISRYCFEDFRLKNENASTFAEHWEKYFNDQINLASVPVEDNGQPSFFHAENSSDKKDIYKKYAENIGLGKLDPTKLSKFYTTCSLRMAELCDQYKPAPSAGSTTQNSISPNLGTGYKSCVTRERLRSIKKAIADTELLAKDFDESFKSGKFSAIGMDEGQLKFFDRSSPNNSIDELTNYSSADFLNGETDAERKAKECEKDPWNPACENMIVSGDKDQTIYNTSLKMRLMDEAEIAKIKKMKDDNDANLKKYLEQNGYFTLLDGIEGKNSAKLETELKAIFDAKRDAVIAKMSDSLKRQVKDDDFKAGQKSKDKTIETAITETAKESAQERQRLGQVVLFNNIITSYLDLQKKDAKGNLTSLGMRNTKAMDVELKGQQSASINEALFTNLKDKTGKGSQENFEITGTEIIDPILGK